MFWPITSLILPPFSRLSVTTQWPGLGSCPDLLTQITEAKLPLQASWGVSPFYYYIIYCTWWRGVQKWTPTGEMWVRRPKVKSLCRCFVWTELLGCFHSLCRTQMVWSLRSYNQVIRSVQLRCECGRERLQPEWCSIILMQTWRGDGVSFSWYWLFHYKGLLQWWMWTSHRKNTWQYFLA